jgi:SAM-dependent methyltransferase
MMFGKPLSMNWAMDRGGLPAHRYYINRFLEEFRGDVRGVCLEFDARNYLDRFGGPNVTTLDVLHLDDSNPRATVVADIARPNSIPDNTYDCIICTHVLHVIEDVGAAIHGLHRILKPGGVLLCAVPHISMVDERFGELWRFTRVGLTRLLARRFGEHNVEVRAYGNSIVAAGELRGLIADEFTWRELHDHSPMAPVEICARAVKQGPVYGP